MKRLLTILFTLICAASFGQRVLTIPNTTPGPQTYQRLKTVGGQSLFGTGDITTGGGFDFIKRKDTTNLVGTNQKTKIYIDLLTPAVDDSTQFIIEADDSKENGGPINTRTRLGIYKTSDGVFGFADIRSGAFGYYNDGGSNYSSFNGVINQNPAMGFKDITNSTESRLTFSENGLIYSFDGVSGAAQQGIQYGTGRNESVWTANTLVDRGYVLASNHVFTGTQQLRVGTATAGTAPLYMPSGTLLTSPANGAFESNGTHVYFTLGGVRYQLDQQTGSSYTASNGLTLTGSNFTLEGTLTKNTTLTSAGFNFNYDGQLNMTMSAGSIAPLHFNGSAGNPSSLTNGDFWTITNGYPRMQIAGGTFHLAFGNNLSANYIPYGGSGITAMHLLAEAAFQYNPSTDVLTSPIINLTGTSTLAAINFATQSAPSSPANGDLWNTGGFLFYRVAGSNFEILSTTATNGQVLYKSSTTGAAVGSANFAYNGSRLLLTPAANNDNIISATMTGTLTGSDVSYARFGGSTVLRATSADVFQKLSFNGTVTTGATNQVIYGVRELGTYTINHTGATLYGSIYYNPTVNGSQTPTHYAAVWGSGRVGIGTLTPTATLDVTGTFTTSSTNTLSALAGTGNGMVQASSTGVLARVSGMTVSASDVLTRTSSTFSSGGYALVNGSVATRGYTFTEGTGNISTTSDGASTQSAFDTSTLPNNTIMVLQVMVLNIKSDGSEGTSIYGQTTWRKDNSGTLTKIGDVTLTPATTDMVGVLSFATTSSGAFIQTTVTRTGTTGNFRYGAYIVPVLIHSY